MLDTIFSDRIADVPRSFIRDILKIAVQSDVISFAGGLPNRDLFPIEQLQASTNKVFETVGRQALQYAESEGLPSLREYIANEYRTKKGIDVDPNRVLITNGSQQGLDLLAKTILNEGEDVVLEEPAYLGAIQSFSVFKARFTQVKMNEDGIDCHALDKALEQTRAKLFYCVPNFQNPSGITYSKEVREKVAGIVDKYLTLLIEDDPYGELRYSGEMQPSFGKLLPHKTVMLGSFSKTVVPAFRLGWMVLPDAIYERVLVAKQAADLHTNSFSQYIVAQFLQDYPLSNHIEKIREVYGRQCQTMIDSIKLYFPKDISYTKPEGGMFLWVTLPQGISAMELFEIALKNKVAFVPGNPFYADERNVSSLRLNFSCVDEQTIKIGIKRLADSIEELLQLKR
jgi:2-aminoadipate transaminase